MKKRIIIITFGIIPMVSCFSSCTAKSEEKIDTAKENRTEMEVKKEDPQKLIIQNMHDAYKGETTAHFKYAAYSKKSKRGWPS